MTHLANELLKRETGIDFVHVPYRSTANSLTDLIGGHIDAVFGDVAILQPQVEKGTIKALAITSAERSPLLPQLATMAEVGLPKVRTEVWYGVLAPSRAPAAVLARLESAVAERAARSELPRGADALWHQPARTRPRVLRQIHPRGTRALDPDRAVREDELRVRRRLMLRPLHLRHRA